MNAKHNGGEVKYELISPATELHNVHTPASYNTNDSQPCIAKRHEDAKLFQYKCIKTGFYFFTWLSFGLACMIGTTLPDFLKRIDIDNEQYGRLKVYENVVAGTIGLFIGSMLDRFQESTDLIMAIGTFLYGFSQIILPWSIHQYFALFLMITFNASGYVTGALGTSYVLSMWGEKANIPMYFLYLGYPCGCTLGPLLARPFISVEIDNVPDLDAGILITGSDERTVTNTSEAILLKNHSLHGDMNMSPKDFPTAETASHIEIPFAISGSLCVLCSAVFMMYSHGLIRRPKTYKLDREPHRSFKDIFNPNLWAAGKPCFGVLIFLIVAIFYASLIAIEGPLTNLFLFTYAVKGQYKFSRADAAYFDTSFKASMFIGRIIAIPFTHFFSIQFLLLFELCFSLAAALCLATLGTQTETYFWVFACLMNFALAPVWPGGYVWAHRYITIYTSMLSFCDVFLRLSDGCFSWLVGYILEYHDPNIMWDILCLLLFIIILAVSIGQGVACRYGERFNDDSVNVITYDIDSSENKHSDSQKHALLESIDEDEEEL